MSSSILDLKIFKLIRSNEQSSDDTVDQDFNIGRK